MAQPEQRNPNPSPTGSESINTLPTPAKGDEAVFASTCKAGESGGVPVRLPPTIKGTIGPTGVSADSTGCRESPNDWRGSAKQSAAHAMVVHFISDLHSRKKA